MILLLYWSETGIIGIFNIVKMIYRGVYEHKSWSLLLYITFFCVHFGGFVLGQGLFLIMFFSPIGFFGSNTFNLFHIIADVQPFFSHILFSLFLLIMSHMVSFFKNYIGQKEYVIFSLKQQMERPYKRVLVMHLSILLGGIYSIYSSSSFIGLIFLIFLKTFFDLRAHIKAHQTGKE